MLDVYISSVTSQLSVLLVGDEINIFKKIEDKDFLIELPEIFDNDDIKNIFKNNILKNVVILSEVGKLTGMRIGEAFAKGLVLGDDGNKIIKLNPHDVLSFSVKSDKRILSILKIRKNSYSLSLFLHKNNFKRLSKNFELSGEQVSSFIKKNEFFIVGEGGRDFDRNLDEKFLFPDALKMYEYKRGLYGKSDGFDSRVQ
ncbi:MAG: hypothetical protein WHT27_01770 [candidate division WOR-3 bacterium]